MLQLPVSYLAFIGHLEFLLFLTSAILRGVKIAASKMIGLDDATSSSSDELGSGSSEEEVYELYDWFDICCNP